jgi:hypothetical protein
MAWYNTPTGDADQITTGTLADARLSANVPIMTAGVLPAVDGSLLTNIPAEGYKKLATVAGVAIDVTTKTTLYTVPGGKTAIIDRVFIRNSSVAPGAAARINFGYSASADDVMATQAISSLSTTIKYLPVDPDNGAVIGNAADAFGAKMSVANGAVGTVTVDVFGYEF